RALPSQDREVVQLPELRSPMEERADVPYLERRDPQLFLQLTPERGLGAFARLDVATWKGDGARHHPLCGLPLLCQDRRLLKDEGRDTLERLSVLPHAAPSLTPLPSNAAVSGARSASALLSRLGGPACMLEHDPNVSPFVSQNGMKDFTDCCPSCSSCAYLARFQTTVAVPPPDAAAAVYRSWSPLMVNGRFCSVPLQLGNVAVSIFKVKVLSAALTDKVQNGARLPPTIALFSSAVAVVRLLEA